MENLLVENEIFCDLDSIKLDLDSDLFDLSPFEFERAAATAAGTEETGGDAAEAFADVGMIKLKMEVDAAPTGGGGAGVDKEAFPLSSLLSPPSTPIITSNNIHPPSWNHVESHLLKSQQQQQQLHERQPQQPPQSPLEGIFTPFEQPPPNKNIINHQDKNVIQQIIDGLQSPSSSSASLGATNVQRRPVVVVSAIQDEMRKNSPPKFQLEMIKDFSSVSNNNNGNNDNTESNKPPSLLPTASRTLVPETNHPIMLHKPLIAKDQKTGSLQLLPESIVNMDGRILSLGDLLSASGLHKNLICNLDIKPFSNATTTPISGSLTPPISSASSVNFGQYLQQQQPQPHFSKNSTSSSNDAAEAVLGLNNASQHNNNDHSSHGLVHKLLTSPINQLIQPWQQQQRHNHPQLPQPTSSPLDSASTVNQSKPIHDSGATQQQHQQQFPTNHSAFAQRKPDPKSKILSEETSLENVFPDSFSTKISSLVSSNNDNANNNNNNTASNKHGTATNNWGESSSKVSPENSLRSVIKNKIIQAKQQTALKSAPPPPLSVCVKREVDVGTAVTSGCPSSTSSSSTDDASLIVTEDLKSRAAAVGVFIEGEGRGLGTEGRTSSTSSASSSASSLSSNFGCRSAISMPSSPVSFGERESFFDAFVKTDLDEIIPEPLDNDCIICGVAFQSQAALRDHLEEHRDHISMIQSGGGGGQSALIDSPPYSSNSSVVGSDDINNGTSSGCPSMADAAEFYVSASMPASPASSTSSLDQLLVTTASPGRGGGGGGSGGGGNVSKRIDTGSTLASLLVSNISPLLTSMDAAAAATVQQQQQHQHQQQHQKGVNNHHHSPLYQRGSQAFAQNLLAAGSTVGGNPIQRSGFVASLFQQQNVGLGGGGGGGVGVAATAAKWKKTAPSGVAANVSSLLGNTSVNDQPQIYGKIVNGDQKKMVKTVDGSKVGQKRKLSSGVMPGMGASKSCPVSPAMKDMMMGVIGGMEGQGNTNGGMGSDLIAGHQGPKTKKCRRVYGLNQKNLWCTQCQWKKACARFKPPKQ
jgi:hypothetical protein